MAEDWSRHTHNMLKTGPQEAEEDVEQLWLNTSSHFSHFLCSPRDRAAQEVDCQR